MGALMKQLWISSECRKLVSDKLQRRLVIISMVLGVSVFLVFVGGLMWALIAANRDPAAKPEALKYVSYGFFGIGGLGLVAFGFLWLTFVRDAKFEIREQELRNAPDMFRFPPTNPTEDPSTQLSDLHSGSRPDLLAIAAAASVAEAAAMEQPTRIPARYQPVTRPVVVSSRHPSESSWSAGGPSVYDPSTPAASSSISTSSERPLTVGYHGHTLLDMPPRPRAISQSEAAVILEPSTLQLSRPSSVTTSSSKDRFIV